MKPPKRHVSTNQTPNSHFQPPKTGDKPKVKRGRHRVSNNGLSVSSARPFIIPVFLPHAGCPHQCVFCNQVLITGIKQNTVRPDQFRRQIRQFLEYKKKDRKPVQIAFFGGTFLGLKQEEIKSWLELAAEFVSQGLVDSIRFSTRPDTIDDARLDLLENYPVATVELGVQSMDDHVLALVRRGHSAADTVRAVGKLKTRRVAIGLQMMVGLPGEDESSALASAREITGLQPDFVRIYPTLVVENSPLAQWYRRGDYAPLSLDSAVRLVAKIYRLFSSCSIPVIRMGLQASRDLDDGATVVAGPYHPAFGHLVYSALFLKTARTALRACLPLSGKVTLNVHPQSISRLRGLKNANIIALANDFDITSIDVVADAGLAQDELQISIP